jgi:hypothetical protein
MKEKTIDEMIEAFLKNGLDMSYFKFLSKYDKESFFHMYENLFESMMKEEKDYSLELSKDKNMRITLHDEEAYFYMTDDYKTLKCEFDRGYYDSENTNQVLILTILFLTVKELKAMIELFTDEMLKNIKENGKNGKTPELTRLPESFVGKAEYLSSRQETIMDDIENARKKVIIKEIR